jgi:hypothetical protein
MGWWGGRGCRGQGPEGTWFMAPTTHRSNIKLTKTKCRHQLAPPHIAAPVEGLGCFLHERPAETVHQDCYPMNAEDEQVQPTAFEHIPDTK